MAESENERAAKRLKTDAEDDCGDAGELSSDSPVSDFEITRILRDCAREKNIFIHGKVKDQDAVVILEKTPIRQDTLSELLKSSQLKLEMKNDVYSTYQLQAPAHLNAERCSSLPGNRFKITLWSGKLRELVLLPRMATATLNLGLLNITTILLSLWTSGLHLLRFTGVL
ncbi:m7GpppX diphosphatase-like isoform X2 [Sinocyclocheilus rhinocerous]|uniref:m7GpppX diphosphatase-like isoform X2 n=1 Tax=Sinocyclocheilus rhinocerous TaxID=307959 RepID=UPI0007BA75E8|nr:PREDICTED: m7GpppX diphosphatase-like isoform X2 [Sinocyclocheilus rhinocerous]